MTSAQSLSAQALAALKQHGFGVEYFAEPKDAAAWLLAQVPVGGSAGLGSSCTVQQIGLPTLLRQSGRTVYDPLQPDRTGTQDTIFRACAQVDAFFCSAVAITADGYVLNVDGTGNRLSMHTFGPKHLYLVVGVNKLVADVPAAFARVQEVAPKNCARVGLPTPCAASGHCMDCDVPGRSCRAYLLLRSPTRSVPATVVLIDRELGL